MSWYVLLLMLVTFLAVDGKLVDNGVLGEPRVECLSDSVRVNFDTEKEFEGHVYVKGHYSHTECRVDATLSNKVNLTIPFATCDMRRQRSNNPKGVHVSVPVIITFHPMFITKIDKSYMVQCFYQEMDKTVTTQLDVSFGKNQEKKIIVMVGDDKSGAVPLREPGANETAYDAANIPPTEVITVQMPLPVCKYQVLSGGPNGEPVKYASVGQLVYHQWSCRAPDGGTGDDGVYCATIHSCTVDEDGGREVQLLDENGCAVDKYLLDNLEYTSDLAGGQLSQVFKFADQSSLFFHCQIRLSIKEDKCKRTSDYCSLSSRGRRAAVEPESGYSNVDVFSQSMTVFDIDDPINKKGIPLFENDALKEFSSGNTCVSTTAFRLLLSLLSLVSMICLFIIAFACLKQGQHSKAIVCTDRI